MVLSRGSISDRSNDSTSDGSDDGEDQDTISVATATSASGDEDEIRHNNQLVLKDITSNKEKPSFGNIAVSNSTDVHFGNKTYYQGPVTIKQFLYANPQISNGEVSDGDLNKLSLTTDACVSVPDSNIVIGKDNPNFIPDSEQCEPNKNSNIDNKIGANGNQEVVSKGAQWLQNFSRQHILLVVSLIAVLVVSLITLLAVLLTRHSPITTNNPNSTPGTFPPDSPEQEKVPSPGLDSNYTLPPKLKIISRIEWVAQPPVEQPTSLNLPVPYVIIMHTATDYCSDHPTCVLHIRIIQQFHIESRGWWDIGYNFVIGGDGFAYEGRGWKSEGAHTYGYNSRSIGIAFIGTYNNTLPPERAITAAKQLIEKGVELNYIAKDYKLLAARQLQSTQSPGQLLFDVIKTWPHWAEKP